MEIKIIFSFLENIREKIAKKIRLFQFGGSEGEGDYLIVAPNIFCGNFYIDEKLLDGSQFSILSTGPCLIDSDYCDEYPLLDMSQITAKYLKEKKPDIFFINTKAPSKTFKIKHKWIESIEPV